MSPSWKTTTVVEQEQLHQEDIEKEYGSEHKRHKFLVWEFETPLIWKNIIGITLVHIISIYSVATHSYLEKPGIVIYGR